MKSFATNARIHASRERIWGLLTDASSWTSWNPTVVRIDGKIALGEKVTVHARLAPGRAFPVRVSELVPNERMVWTGGMPLGLFRGERTYLLAPRDGAVEFSMREVFSGLLAPLIGKSIPDMQRTFDEFAASLKKAAEES